MNKLGLILPALLLFFACLGGATVPQTQAEEVGYQWLRHVFAEKDGSRFSEVRAVEKDGLAMYYILNVEGGGYVLVAADDACEPILGYSDTGKFVYPIDSPAVRYWLGTYEDQLLLAREKSISSAAKRPLWDDIRAGIFSRWDFTRAVSPLLATTWNQDTYYNQSCPADAAGPNGHAYAGCAATAMGQVMKKWNHPAQGTISHSYVENTYGTLSANFGATTYNWASMPNSLTTYNSAVATLLYHCGVGVDMDYGPYASSANAMTNDSMEVFFGYNPAAQWQWRSTYSDPTWISMMQGDLTAGRPVIYSGYNSGYTTGHTFVMDGFNASNYFHINWGWGGSYDGYFALNSLIPLTGYDYSYFQWAYFNLYPGATISGTVTNSSGIPLSGVWLSLSGAGNATTGTNGVYSIAVTSGYSGTATPYLSGYSFTPASRTYTNVTSNQTAQNYTGSIAATPPANLWTGNITSSSATFNWTEMGTATAWDVEFGPAGFTLGSGNRLTAVTQNPITLNGFLPNTPYDWYVRSNYGSYTSSWSGPVLFTTMGAPQPPPINLATTAITNSSATLSWTEIGSAWLWDVEYGPPGFLPGTGNSYGFTYNSPSNIWTVNPLLSGTNFDWYVRSNYGATFSAWAGPASFTTLGSPPLPPIGLITSAVTNTTATLSWTEQGGALMWDVEYGFPGFLPGSGTLLRGVGNPYTLAGLAFGTPYDWYVRSNHSVSGATAWSGPASFVTLATPPPPPFNLLTSAITQNSAVLDWTEAGSATTWDVEVGPGGFLPGVGMAFQTVTVNGLPQYVTLPLLPPAAPIDWYVRSRYGTYLTPWSGPASFITLAVPPPPPFGLVTSGITQTGAVLTWSEPGTANLWDIEIGLPGFLPGSGTAIQSIQMFGPLSTLPIGGLTPNTPHDWFVRSNYVTATTPWAGPASFVTLPPGLPYPWQEDFEAGWVNLVSDPASSLPWTLDASLFSSGVQSAWNAYAANNSNILITSNTFDLTPSVWPMLYFNHIAKTENNWDHCYVEISTNGGGNWNILPPSEYRGLGNYVPPLNNNPEGPCFMSSSYPQWSGSTPDNSWWREEKFDLRNYQWSNSVMLRFRLKSDNSVHQRGWSIDNVRVQELPQFDFSVANPSGASVGAGLSHDYPVAIFNTGQNPDSYLPGFALTGLWNYAFFEANGSTPLTVPITLPPGGTYNFVVKVTTPAGGPPLFALDTEGITILSQASGQVISFPLATVLLYGDTLADAILIPSLPYSQSSTTVGYNHNYGPYGALTGLTNLIEPVTGGYYASSTLGAADVVYKLVLGAPTSLSIDLAGSLYDTAVALVSAPATAPTDVLLLNEDYYTTPVNYVSYVDTGCNSVPAGTYYIIVSGFSVNQGNYTLTVTAAPTPVAPTVTISLNASGQIVLSWTQNTVMRYDIYSDTNPYGSYATAIATNVNAGSYTIVTAPAARTFYQVKERFCWRYPSGKEADTPPLFFKKD